MGLARHYLRANEVHCMARSALFGLRLRNNPLLFTSLLTAVWLAFSWCRRYFGMQYALLAAFTTAISYELINFGPRALIELIAAASTSHLSRFFGTRSKAGKQVATWRLLLIGLLLGLTVCLCIQFAPAVLLAGLWIMSRDWNSRAKNRMASSWHARWAWPANFPGGTRLGAAAFSELSLDSQACGVAVFKVDWSDTGGYTYPRRAIPVFFFPSSRWHSPPIRRTIELLHRN